MAGYFKSPGGKYVRGPNNRLVRVGTYTPPPTARTMSPSQVTVNNTVNAGTQIAELVFSGFPVQNTVPFTYEFTDEFDGVSYTATLTSDAGGKVALAGSWGEGYRLVAGSGPMTAGVYSFGVEVSGFPETYTVTLTVEAVVGSDQLLFTSTVDNFDTVASWTDQELSLAQWFAPGDVPDGNIAVVSVDGVRIPQQMSNRTTWVDGSLKLAQVRLLMPVIQPGTSKTLTWTRTSGSWTQSDTGLHTSPTTITGKVALEYSFSSFKGRTDLDVMTAERGPKNFKSATMLGAANAPWIDTIMAGPVCSEWRASDMATKADGTKDPAENLGCLLYARAWGGSAGNPKRIQFFYRSIYGWDSDVAADEQGIRVDLNLRVNGVVVRGAAIGTAGWDKVNGWKGGFFVSAGAEGTMDWYDVTTSSFVTPPKIIHRHNVTYGVKAKFIPPFDTSNPAFPMTPGVQTYQPGKRGPLRPIQDDVADHAMLCWTTAKPMAWCIAAAARATAQQLSDHQRYARSAGFGMGAMTNVGLYRSTRKILSYLPPDKSSNQQVLGASIYGQGRPAETKEPLRHSYGSLVDISTFTTKIGTGTTSVNTTTGEISIAYVAPETTLRGTRPVVVGQAYKVLFTISGSVGQFSFGNTVGGTQYKAVTTGVLGVNGFYFTATTSTLHISFTKNTAGTAIFSDFRVSVPEIAHLDTSHFPQLALWPYISEGDQHWLDLMYTEATLPSTFDSDAYGFFGTSNRAKIPYGGIVWKGQIRAVGHTIRPIGNAVGAGNPADPHWVLCRDLMNHWCEMNEELPIDMDWERGGVDRTDGRRFQDLKVLLPNNEPTYKIWMHTFGLHALSYSFGISQQPRLRARAEWFAYAPTVMCGGYHNDVGDQYYLMKPDPTEGIGYQQICMNGLTDNVENRRYWNFGQWRGFASPVTYKADGQTVVWTDAPDGIPDGVIVSISGVRSATEPHWVVDNTKVPSGITRGIPYYVIQSSGQELEAVPVSWEVPRYCSIRAGQTWSGRLCAPRSAAFTR